MASETASEISPVEMPSDELGGDASMPPRTFPPYPPYATEPEPPSVASTIVAGRELRVAHKFTPKKPVRPPPKPARPRGPKATDVKMPRAAMRAHARCLRRHGAVLSDRLETLAKPCRRNVICLWRENALNLPADTIARLRGLLDADEPFKPDQAYEYFINQRKGKTKRRNAKMRVNQIKKDILTMCADKRFMWARNATVAFARGIQQRLSRPGSYALADKMLRLSNIILDDICSCIHTRTPSRRNTNPKARFIMEMADKVAVWIDEILAESDDHMLMMDFDEDEEVMAAIAALEGGSGFADDFLDMMGGAGGPGGPGGGAAGGGGHGPGDELYGPGGGRHGPGGVRGGPGGLIDGWGGAGRAGGGRLRASGPPAYLQFTGDQLEAFKILTDSMAKKGDEPLVNFGKFKASYKESADELKRTPDFEATNYDKALAATLNKNLNTCAKANTPENLAAAMKDMVDLCSNYLAQNAEYNKDKGEAFKLLVNTMKKTPDDLLFLKGRIPRTFGQAAVELEEAKSLASDHDDPQLSKEIRGVCQIQVAKETPEELKPEMEGTVDQCSKYLSQGAVDDEKGLEYLIKIMKEEGDASLAKLQGKEATFASAGKRVEDAELLSYDRKAMDPETYDAVQVKLAELSQKKPSPQNANSMPGVVDEASKFLSAPPEDPEVRRRRLEEMERRKALGLAGGADEDEETRRKREAGGLGEEDEETRRQREADEARRRAAAQKGLGTGDLAEDAETRRKRLEQERLRLLGLDPEREEALRILHNQLQSRRNETLHKQQSLDLTYGQASEWLKKPPFTVDKSVKESADTDRLHKKIERKLGTLVEKVTPSTMSDAMQDVVIESSRSLSEYYVAGNYKTLVKDALISEMQKRGNEILKEIDGTAETFFFAAQRLKKAKGLTTKEHCAQVAYDLTKKLEDMIRCRSMARKLTATMKDHIKDASDYLSGLVTKPDSHIEAYVTLLGEMESAGDARLIEGDIPKSFKDSAAYLRELTTFEDRINKPNSSLQSATESKLKQMMANVPERGYTKSILSGVISESTKLLVSYIMYLGQKTEALKELIKEMDKAGDAVLLRHGVLRKSFVDGAELLRGKTADQLSTTNVDPVVARKIQLKLKNLMKNCTPKKFELLMDDVIEDATMYLAVRLLQPAVMQVCKCMKNVFVQCELWCEEILRRVTRPCCTCSRHVSAQALADLAPGQQLRIGPGSSKAFAPGIEISVKTCPSRSSKGIKAVCPSAKPTPGCDKVLTSYFLYSTSLNQGPMISHSGETGMEAVSIATTSSNTNLSDMTPMRLQKSDNLEANTQMNLERDFAVEPQSSSASSMVSYHTPPSTSAADVLPQLKKKLFWQSPTAMYSKIQKQHVQPTPVVRDSGYIKSGNPMLNSRTSIVCTTQMSDWHAMMVSLMWNVKAWRDWIQENIDRGLNYQPQTYSGERWTTFQRRVITEALQWRQYNIFTRQLTLRLSLKYRNKQIVSPTRATVKTEAYMECQKHMLEIINMFNKWTQWLTLLVKETDALECDSGSEGSLEKLYHKCWNHFKTKVEKYAEDWSKYNIHLKHCWEYKYTSIISDWLPSWSQQGPVWVVSACGTVPSGAVAAGVFEGEVIWVARTTHKCNVLPATLHPSKHCCFVYADGAVHHYTKYQVMCNAEVKWLPWRAGEVGARAVKIAPGVYVGRIHYRGSHLLGAVHAPSYRCYVVIFGRPFAFSCYELLVL